MKKSSNTFKKNLGHLFQESGWSQSEFGKQIGVSQVQARRYLQGESSPPFEIIDKIATAFGVSPSYFFREETHTAPADETLPTLPSDLTKILIKLNQQDKVFFSALSKLVIEFLASR